HQCRNPGAANTFRTRFRGKLLFPGLVSAGSGAAWSGLGMRDCAGKKCDNRENGRRTERASLHQQVPSVEVAHLTSSEHESEPGMAASPAISDLPLMRRKKRQSNATRSSPSIGPRVKTGWFRHGAWHGPGRVERSEAHRLQDGFRCAPPIVCEARFIARRAD